MDNKRILVLGIALILTAMIVGAALADEQDTEYQYTIEVSYRTPSGIKTVTYTLWASSAADAREQAIKLCEYEKDEAVSCGAARATGRSR